MLRVEDGTGVVQGHMQDLAASMLKNCTVVELRAVCRHKGIPVEGTRDQLLRRLVIESATGEEESEHRAPCTPPRRRRSSAVKPCGPMAENSSEKHQEDVQRLGACIDLQEKTKQRRRSSVSQASRPIPELVETPKIEDGLTSQPSKKQRRKSISQASLPPCDDSELLEVTKPAACVASQTRKRRSSVGAVQPC